MKKLKYGFLTWCLPLPLVWWAALLCAGCLTPNMKLAEMLTALSKAMNVPFAIHWTERSFSLLLVFSIIYGVAVAVYFSSKKNYRRGEEHGSAKWGNVFQLCRKYRDKKPEQNLILTQNFRLGLDGYKHKRNLNVLVIGGSGAGKTRTYAVPNILQCNCSFVVTDPKAGAERSAMKSSGTVLLNN